MLIKDIITPNDVTLVAHKYINMSMLFHPTGRTNPPSYWAFTFICMNVSYYLYLSAYHLPESKGITSPAYPDYYFWNLYLADIGAVEDRHSQPGWVGSPLTHSAAIKLSTLIVVLVCFSTVIITLLNCFIVKDMNAILHILYMSGWSSYRYFFSIFPNFSYSYPPFLGEFFIKSIDFYKKKRFDSKHSN